MSKKRLMIHLTGHGDVEICFVPLNYQDWFDDQKESAPPEFYERMFKRMREPEQLRSKDPQILRDDLEPYALDSSTWWNDRMLLCMSAFKVLFGTQEALRYAEENDIEIVDTIDGQIY